MFPSLSVVSVMGQHFRKRRKEVPFTSKEQDSIVAPEGHHNSGGLVEGNHFVIVKTTRIPDSNLSIAHPAEARGSEGILLAHPNDAHALDATVALSNADGISASARIKQADFPVPASRNKNVTNSVKGKALDCVAMTTEGGLR